MSLLSGTRRHTIAYQTGRDRRKNKGKLANDAQQPFFIKQQFSPAVIKSMLGKSAMVVIVSSVSGETADEDEALSDIGFAGGWGWGWKSVFWPVSRSKNSVLVNIDRSWSSMEKAGSFSTSVGFSCSSRRNCVMLGPRRPLYVMVNALGRAGSLVLVFFL